MRREDAPKTKSFFESANAMPNARAPAPADEAERKPQVKIWRAGGRPIPRLGLRCLPSSARTEVERCGAVPYVESSAVCPNALVSAASARNFVF
jgi:hypothetical protein